MIQFKKEENIFIKLLIIFPEWVVSCIIFFNCKRFLIFLNSYFNKGTKTYLSI